MTFFRLLYPDQFRSNLRTVMVNVFTWVNSTCRLQMKTSISISLSSRLELGWKIFKIYSFCTSLPTMGQILAHPSPHILIQRTHHCKESKREKSLFKYSAEEKNMVIFYSLTSLWKHDFMSDSSVEYWKNFEYSTHVIKYTSFLLD